MPKLAKGKHNCPNKLKDYPQSNMGPTYEAPSDDRVDGVPAIMVPSSHQIAGNTMSKESPMHSPGPSFANSNVLGTFTPQKLSEKKL